MYIVRNKATGQIIHVNPAPVSQGLEGTDIYYQIDLATMEVARGDLPEVPDHFDIDGAGAIVPWTLERKVLRGVLTLPPDLKAVGNTVVPKTLSEKVADGTVQLRINEKLVGDRIEPKTVAEMVDDGSIRLTPTQIVDGDEVREMTEGEKVLAGLTALDPRLKVVDGRIVPKTPAELIQDDLLKLAPDETLQGDTIVKLTPREMLDQNIYNLNDYKEAVIARYTEISLTKRRALVQDHMLTYVALGLVETELADSYRTIAANHVDELDHVIRSIKDAVTANEVDAIVDLGPWLNQPVRLLLV